MAHVSVTVLYPHNQQIDLMLPDNIACQFLTEALSSPLNLPNSTHFPWVFTIADDERNGQQISPETTLSEAGILFGSLLKLTTDAYYSKPEAYLVAENGKKYVLQKVNSIGRNDEAEHIHVDIDISPLCQQRVASRKHAIIQLNELGQYIIQDHSKHGTWLNEQKLTKETILKHGDILDFGHIGKGARLVFLWNNQPVPPSIEDYRRTRNQKAETTKRTILQPSLISDSGETFAILKSPFSIGRPDKHQTPDLDLRWFELDADHPISSRTHCSIMVDECGHYRLYAHVTANGTFINGQELAPRDYKQLENNDCIEFGYGGVKMTFHMPD